VLLALIAWRLRDARQRLTSPPAPPPREPTRKELYEEAKRLNIPGRSKMNKAELRRAVDEASR
jgi:hypothetical protein